MVTHPYSGTWAGADLKVSQSSSMTRSSIQAWTKSEKVSRHFYITGMFFFCAATSSYGKMLYREFYEIIFITSSDYYELFPHEFSQNQF